MRMIMLAVVLLFASSLQAAVATPAEEKEVLSAMTALADAVGKRDAAALQRLLHDELVYSHSDTRAESKADLVKQAQENRGPGGVALAEPKVHIYGNTAIVRGRVGNAKGVLPNSPHAVAVFVKGPQGWQIVARTATRPSDPAAARGGTRSGGGGRRNEWQPRQSGNVGASTCHHDLTDALPRRSPPPANCSVPPCLRVSMVGSDNVELLIS